MRRFALGYLFGILTAIAGFGAAQSAWNQFGNPGGGKSATQFVRWSTVKSGTQSNMRASVIEVINSEAEWQSYWSRAGHGLPQNAPKSIDFGKEMGVAIHIGTRNTGGYETYVQSVERVRGNDTVVKYVEKTPAQGAVVSQSLTSPYVIIRVDRIGGRISFEKEIIQAKPAPQIINVKPLKCCGCTCPCCIAKHKAGEN